MYLNHDHRERENVRFLAICPTLQDLWCSPPRSVATLTRGTLDRIQVLSDCSEAEIRNACIAGVVHQDVWLISYQYRGKARFKTSTYSLEVPMNYIAGVEVTEAINDVVKLVTGVST